MATLQKRTRSDGSHGYRVRWYDPDTDDKPSLTFDDRDEAKRFKTLLEASGHRLSKANEAMIKIKAKEPSVAEVAERHIKGMTGVSARTRADARRDVRNHIAPDLGTFPISVPDQERIRAWVNDRQDAGMAPKTLRNIHGLLSAIFTTAMNTTPPLRDDNPCRGIRLPEGDDEEMVFLDNREFAVLLEHVAKPYRLFVRFLVGTGVRWGEAVAITPADITFPKPGKARVRINKAWKRLADNSMGIGAPKTKRGRRTVPIPTSMVAEIKELCLARPSDQPLFTTRSGSRLHHGNFSNRVWKPAIEAATAVRDKDGHEISREKRIEKQPRIHDLRHTYASWMLAQGIDITKLSRLLGHESITTTVDRYGHVDDQQYDDVADAVDVALNVAM